MRSAEIIRLAFGVSGKLDMLINLTVLNSRIQNTEFVV